MEEIDFPIQMYSEESSKFGFLTVNSNFMGNIGYYRGGSGGFSSARFRGRGSGYSTPRGMNSPRGRGRGQSGTQTPNYYDVGSTPSRGRGSDSPYGQQRGRGFRSSASKLHAGAPLSKLLYEDRPLLRPIVFVRSVYTATLFQEDEDILKAAVEEPDGEESHVPTADQVTRVFNGAAEEDAEQYEDELEEIDFSEVGRIQAEVDAASTTLPSTSDVTVVEEKFTGFYIDTNPTPISQDAQIDAGKVDEDALGISWDEDEIVYVAPHPRAGPVTPPQEAVTFEPLPTTSILTGLAPSSEVPLGPSEESTNVEANGAATRRLEDSNVAASLAQTELVVADTVGSANIPKTEPEADIAIPAVPSFDSVSFSLLSSVLKKQERRIHPVHTPRSLLKRLRRTRSTRKPPRHFGSFGAMLSEAHLREEAGAKERDPRKNEQRRGDSDVDWGDDSEEDNEIANEVDEISSGVGGMDLDGEFDLKTMSSFVHSMSPEGSRHITMDDLADIEQIQQEDEEDEEDEEDNESSEDSEEDEEVKMVLQEEERMLIAESDGDEDEDEDETTSDEDAPSGSFQARLDRIRKAKGKRKADIGDEDTEEDDFDMALEMSWADGDEAFIAQIQSFVDEDQQILSRKDRKQRDRIFRAIQNGDWNRDEYEEMMGQPASAFLNLPCITSTFELISVLTSERGKDKSIPLELREQWQKDRDKKAENKRKRALARQEIAADPLARKKGGKKGLKAALAAARLDPSIEIPNRVVDLVTLEQQIRRFLADIGGSRTMVLPPADKETRTKVHELAGAFNLKSQSKGSGSNRYTTLVRTTKSGIAINERKVRRILNTVNPSWEGPGRGGRNHVASLAKHKEGEEVGKAAPKIGESNVGFQMLAAMGWSEGGRIGLSGGLHAPLVAVMKKTKLGLGATLS
ncbi:unnamed protein product [Somion occarium]|uniref:Protein SQS1 n=1 Tax=Somion occarium TaxID=3059160 RepID=A0ABP1DGB6_9APHY